jgi:hypothetical protein
VLSDVHLFASLSLPIAYVHFQGVLLSEVMKQISPEYFEYEVNHGSSWAGHKINNARLVKGLEDYYRTEHR